MKYTGVYRRIDGLGRIVLPWELLQGLNINEDDNFEICIDEETGTVALRKDQSGLHSDALMLAKAVEGYLADPDEETCLGQAYALLKEAARLLKPESKSQE